MSDPKEVEIIRREKEGGWYRFEGIVDGKKTSVDIHAKDIESRSKKDAEGLAQRSLYGTSKIPEGERR